MPRLARAFAILAAANLAVLLAPAVARADDDPPPAPPADPPTPPPAPPPADPPPPAAAPPAGPAPPPADQPAEPPPQPPVTPPRPPPTAPASPPADAPTEPRPAGDADKERPPWQATVDFVGGAATLDVLAPRNVALASLGVPNERDSMRVTALTLLIAVERRLDALRVGARVPFTQGSLESRTGATSQRDRLIGGNLTLEGAYRFLRMDALDIEGGLELALPTGAGKEQPGLADGAGLPTQSKDFGRFDRWAVARAGSAVRGAYDSALFESGRFGIVPKVGATYTVSKISIQPAVKLQNLVDVTGNARRGYVGELVLGVRASYRALEWLAPGVHVWTNAALTPSEVANASVGVIEPFVRFPLGAVTPQVAAIVPFAGHLVDEKAFGLRAAVAGEF